jgi:lantibiotic modifying enzyme
LFDPRFFLGVTGIGYTLLRLRAPIALPCVLALE